MACCPLPPGALTVLPFPPPPPRSGVWAKDHCDYLLDSIDAQLSQLQAQGPIKGNSRNGSAPLDGTMGVSKAADLGGCDGDGDGEASPAEDSSSQTEEDTWWQAHCLDLEGSLEDQSRSDSVCTEDLAATFQAGLVDLLLNSDSEGEEDAFALAIIPRNIQQSQAESTNPSQDSKSTSDSVRKQTRVPSVKDVLRPECGQDSLIPCSEEPPSPCAQCRMWSLESLGEKISLLSQKDSEGTTNPAWRKGLQPQRILNLGELGGSTGISEEKAFWEPGQRSKTFVASSEWIQDLHENSSSPLLIGDLDPWPPLEVAVGPVKMSDHIAPTRTIQPSTKVCLSPRRDSLRSLGSRDEGAVEEELARLCPGGTHGTSCPASQTPCQAADPIRKAALLGPCRGCELRPSQECRDELQTKVSQLVTERKELKARVEQLEEQLSSLKLQLKSSKAEFASVKEMADKMKQLREAALSEKESELSRVRKIISVLEAEKEAQSSAVERLREEQTYQLEALQRETQQEKEKDLFRLREELQREKRRELQEAKASILQEQAAGFQKEVKSLRKAIEEQEADLRQQEEVQRQQVKKLKQEAEEMVQITLLQEQKKWEADTRAALQLQRQALQEQNQRAQMDLQAALEGERKTSLALRGENANLCMRIEKLESQVQAFHGEKKGAMEELQDQLQKEKAEALKQLQEKLEQERMHERDQMRAKMKQMEEDHRLLQAELRERESQAHDGWGECSVAQEVALTCQQLQNLLPKKAGGPVLAQMFHGLAAIADYHFSVLRSPALLPSSHLLQVLQGLCREIQLYLQGLKNETEMQRQDILQLQREKERELRQQQERLHLENQLALEALKDQLVQEHMEDIAALQHSWLQEVGAKEDWRPPQPVPEKDGKLRAIERNTDRWREQLARERRSRDKAMEFHRDQEMPESEIQPFSMGNYFRPHPCCSRWLHTAATFSSPCHFTTPKLLQHLQSRLRELRTANVAYGGASLDNLGSFRGNLADTCEAPGCWVPLLLSAAWQQQLEVEPLPRTSRSDSKQMGSNIAGALCHLKGLLCPEPHSIILRQRWLTYSAQEAAMETQSGSRGLCCGWKPRLGAPLSGGRAACQGGKVPPQAPQGLTTSHSEKPGPVQESDMAEAAGALPRVGASLERASLASLLGWFHHALCSLA
ncbi:hypothetical protein JD844_015038 [Phrynosoma platyrhinos]|uniref:Uncharacterized protein n=1 Tax=Phrynosoma platyrhinos TaxID=52577 RepID=A0ABQ7T6Z3_PHRPL|nr:hypothetical protein JD844_015038 [Phrynosoma platyrhinos]